MDGFNSDIVPEEPRVQIRRPITRDSSIAGQPSSYGAASPPLVIDLPPSDPAKSTLTSSTPIATLNSVNLENGSAGPIVGNDKAPLIGSQRSLLQSLAGISSMQPPLMPDRGRRDGLGTLMGVFAPVAMSMFSVLLFLRMGFVVGQSGILVSLAQLVLAYAIVSLTVFSLCAISTNGAIEGGGVYYMISRALGPEFGGSIGILFFLANVFSCGIYIAGFREILINNFGPGTDVEYHLMTGRWYSFLYDLCISLLILAMCLVGAGLFGKASVVFLSVVTIVYLSFLGNLMVNHRDKPIILPSDNPICEINDTFIGDNCTAMYTGVSQKTFSENLMPQYGVDYTTGSMASFAIVFAIVFSGVTGIMAGANMSGELRDPGRSIPAGTLQAVGVTFLVYILTTFLLGASCSNKLLKNNYTVMQGISRVPWMVVIGVISAAFFAGMSNLIGASRVLLRLAEDKLFGPILYPATLTVCGNNPIFAVLISWALVVCVLLIGTLNKIAQIASIFFLLSYAGVNMACLALDLASAPNFRPHFKYFSWQTSFMGFVGCIAMMFVIDPVFTGVAIIILLLLLMSLHYLAPMASWGSISQALIFHQVRKYLLLLDSRKDHVKYWRPQILLLVNNPKSCCPLIDFVNDLKKSGLYVIGHVKLGSMDDYALDPVLEDYPYWLGLVDYLRVKAFVELTVADTTRHGIQHLARISGIGAMKPNTVIMGFYDESHDPEDTFHNANLLKNIKYAKLEREDIEEYFHDLRKTETDGRQLSALDYVHIIQDCLRMNKNICIARHFNLLDKQALFANRDGAYIDVWPVDMGRPASQTLGFDNSCLFLLQLSCILNMVSKWKSRMTLRVFLCITSLQDVKFRDNQLRKMLQELRIKAKTIMVPWDHVICHLPDPSSGSSLSTPPGSSELDTSIDFSSCPARYVQSMNETIRRHIDRKSAIVFLNMPVPPSQEDRFRPYLANLDVLSSGLPPTLMVHGLSSVISTAL